MRSTGDQNALVSVGSLAGRNAALVREVDDAVRSDALGHGAIEIHCPPVLSLQLAQRLGQLEKRLDQLDFVAHGSRSSASGDSSPATIDLAHAGLVLPTAACLAVFPLHLSISPGPNAVYTAVSTCFRRETHYEPGRRLPVFTMREVVAIGERKYVNDWLRSAPGFFATIAARFGISIVKSVASDSFLDSADSTVQRGLGLKSEFLWNGLAIGSLNRHLTHFGRVLDLFAEGRPAHSACLAFGLERWATAVAADPLRPSGS
jgi:hypothetical protein